MRLTSLRKIIHHKTMLAKCHKYQLLKINNYLSWVLKVNDMTESKHPNLSTLDP